MMMGEEIKAAEAAKRVWIVVQAKPSQEKLAAEELEARGFEVYLPLKLVERKVGRKFVVISAPYLPRYLFVRVALQVDQWKVMFRTRGVNTVMGGLRPIGLKDEVVERIRQAEDAGFIRLGLEEEAPRVQFQARQKVLLDKGKADVEALFLERVDERRAEILVSLLGVDSVHTVDLRKLRAQTA